MSYTVLEIEHELAADDAVELSSRRQFTYSQKALQAGARIEKVFVNDAGMQQVLEAFDRINQLREAISITQGMRLVGPSGCGKTTAVRYFQATLPSNGCIENSTRTLYLRLQERPSVNRLMGALLRAVRYPFASVSTHNLSLRRDVLIEALKQRGTSMMFLDEAHYLCQQRKDGRADQLGTYATDFLRELIDEAKLILVLIGDKSLDRLGEIDSHLDARVPIRISLQNIDRLDRNWPAVVTAMFANITDVDMRGVISGAGLWRLHLATDGNMRRLKWLVSEVVMVCIDAQQPHVRDQDLALAFKRLNGVDGDRGNPWEVQDAKPAN